MQLLRGEFPADARQLSPALRPYAKLADSLYELDGVLMLSERIVVLRGLGKQVLGLLHAAHQGVDRMQARAVNTVFWPGMKADMYKLRQCCPGCNSRAPSNPTQPPVDPPIPEYPFQYLAADYFHHLQSYYLVVVDRYSHWPSVVASKKITWLGSCQLYG